jgi:hypothetical protein
MENALAAFCPRRYDPRPECPLPGRGSLPSSFTGSRSRQSMHLVRRIEKARRYLSWRLATRGLPLWWHVGRPNFGDDINPTFFQKIAGRARER